MLARAERSRDREGVVFKRHRRHRASPTVPAPQHRTARVSNLTSVALPPHLSATYWANGLINTLNSRLGSLPTWTYNPEGEGRASAVSDSTPQTLVAPTSYNLYGLPTGMTFGSTDYDSFQYDATGRMTQFAAVVRSSSMTGVPTWNTNGSLQQLAITDGFNGNNTQSCTYQHDDLARIAAVNCGTGKWNQTYSYGSNGFGNVNWTGTGLGTNFTAAYNAGNNHFASLGTYDSNGNLLTDGTHTYTWDADGKLYQIVSGSTTTTMTYDALGRRVEQAAGSTYTEVVYGPGGGKLALVNGSGQAVISAFIPLPAGATAVYAGNTLNRYRHSDWLGSSRLSSTPTQPTSVAYDGAYSPMGESYVETGTTDRNFTGQNQDLTTGSSGDLYDFAFREYHPIHGRWISPDPAGLAAVTPANPQSWNRYAYVNGSPLNSIDPLGLMCVAYSMGPQNCGYSMVYSWASLSQGWDMKGGVSVPPVGGIGNSGGVAAANRWFEWATMVTSRTWYCCDNRPYVNEQFNPNFTMGFWILTLGNLSRIGEFAAGSDDGTFGPRRGGGGGGGTGSGTPQVQPFWQKPGCGTAITGAALGTVLTAGEAVAVVYLGPELLAVAGETLAEGGAVMGTVEAGHLLFGASTALVAAPILAIEGFKATAAKCF